MGAIGGILVALGLAAAKFKTLLVVLFSFKWLVLAPKLLLSFGSMFLSVWLYAQWFGGWKIGIVFVLMILVHELGHYLASRWRGVYVEAFSIGFGRPLLQWIDRVCTVWKLAWIPLGFYVKMH